MNTNGTPSSLSALLKVPTEEGKNTDTFREPQWPHVGRMQVSFALHALLCVVLLACVASQSGATGKTFYLIQDMAEGKCLGSEQFTRCGLDTLWYLSGPSGAYSIHLKNLNDENDSDVCLSKAACKLTSNSEFELVSEVKTGRCAGCRTTNWNIAGDNITGFRIIQDELFCLSKEKGSNRIIMNPCSAGALKFSLHFVTPAGVLVLNGKGAAMIKQAAVGNYQGVKEAIQSGIHVNSLDWNAQTALMAAAEAGNEDIVKYLLSLSANSGMKDKDENSATTLAAMAGHVHILELLAEAGASMDTPSATGMTPLFLAVHLDHIDVVEYLLTQFNANANVKRNDGITALILAATEGHEESTRLLLEAGADPNVADLEGLSPLMPASQKGYEGIVSLLLKHGADPNAAAKTSYTPLIYAASGRQAGTAALLLEGGAEVDLPTDDDLTALIIAASLGQEQLVNVLIEHGANVNMTHHRGASALFVAATNGNLPILTTLVDLNADVQLIDQEGHTTLMAAASNGHHNICKLLIERGVPLDHASSFGATALMMAAKIGAVEAVNVISAAGADLNVQVVVPNDFSDTKKMKSDGPWMSIDEDPSMRATYFHGATALMLATVRGHIDVATILVERGAHINITDAHGRTALTMAAKLGFEHIVTVFVESGADPNQGVLTSAFDDMPTSLLMKYIIEENEVMAMLVIEKGADVGYVDPYGGTVLIQAAYLGQVSVVATLLLHGADPHVKNEDGTGPFMAGAGEGHVDILTVLLDGTGLTADEKDYDDTTALMAACLNGHLLVAEYLLTIGANVNSKNAHGHTALNFAINGQSRVDAELADYKRMNKGKKHDEKMQNMMDDSGIFTELIELLVAHKKSQALGASGDITNDSNDEYADSDADSSHESLDDEGDQVKGKGKGKRISSDENENEEL